MNFASMLTGATRESLTWMVSAGFRSPCPTTSNGATRYPRPILVTISNKT